MKTLHSKSKTLNYIFQQSLTAPKDYKTLWHPKIVKNLTELIKEKKIYSSPNEKRI
jgi:hypothetical protein